MSNYKKKQLPLLLLSALIGAFEFSLEGCGDSPNPCKALKPVNADFEFKEGFYEIDTLFAVDTVFVGARVTFNAYEDNASYDWKVGDYPQPLTKKSFFFNFNEPYGKIETTLIVNKQPNQTCFPKDNGMDTVKKSLFVLDEDKVGHAFEGTFAGYNTDSPTEVFDVTIADFGPTPIPDPINPFGFYGIRIYNLPKGCGGKTFTKAYYTPEIGERNYRNFYIRFEDPNVEGDCPELFNGFGRVTKNNKMLEIDYTIGNYIKGPNNPTKMLKGRKKFIGFRKK